ncbi:MAG: sulfotransferase family 2 domain-containing protein [Phycisphaeraceae bacterium]|nr:MAG: sulfotransferase family 2 domain-containing protein [Phycisphaeraceae bacterium]
METMIQHHPQQPGISPVGPECLTDLLGELLAPPQTGPLRVEIWTDDVSRLAPTLRTARPDARLDIHLRTPSGRGDAGIDAAQPFAAVSPNRDAVVAWELTVDRAGIAPVVDAISACGGEAIIALRPPPGTQGARLVAWRTRLAHAVSEAGGDAEHLGVTVTGSDVYRIRRLSTRPLLVHIHVPKCGGQSIHKHLWDTWGDDRFRYLQPFHVSSSATLERWLSQHPEADAISSHTFIRAHPKRLAGRTCLYVTTLRHPVRQLVSHVRYVGQNYQTFPPRFKKHLPAKADELAPADLARALIDGETYSFQHVLASWYLAVQQRYTPLLTALLERFTLVGITEYMDLSLRLLSRRLAPYGLDLPPPERAPQVNRSARGPGEVEVALERQIRRYLDTRFPAELGLYSWALARFKEEIAEAFGEDAAETIDPHNGDTLGLKP